MSRAALAVASVSLRRQGVRNVTSSRTPRPPGDMRVLLDGVGKINERLDELTDHARRADARLDETVKRTAASDAALDRLKDDHERGQMRLDNRTEEILRTQNNSYRQFEAGLREVKEKVAVLEDAVNAHKAEDILAATEGASKGAAKGAMDNDARKTTRTIGLISFLTLSGTLLTNADKIWGVLLKLARMSTTGDGP